MGIFNIFKSKKDNTVQVNKLAPHDDALRDDEYLDKEDDIELPEEAFSLIPEEEKVAPISNPNEEDEENNTEQDEDDDEQLMDKDLDKELGLSKQSAIKDLKLDPKQILANFKQDKKNNKKQETQKGDTWDGKTSERNLHRETGGTEIDYEALMLKNEREPGHDEMLADLEAKDRKQVSDIKKGQDKTDDRYQYMRYRKNRAIKKAIKKAGSHIDKEEARQIKALKKKSITDLD